MNLAEKLLELRQQKGCSQQNVADYLGIHKSLYCNYEKGQRTPNLEKLNALSNFYNVPLRSLIILPLKNTVVYSDGLLDELEAAIEKYNGSGNDYNRVKKNYRELNDVLHKVINERNEALDFPNIGIDISEYVGKTIKEVMLDMRGEKLIYEALKVQMRQLDYINGGER